MNGWALGPETGLVGFPAVGAVVLAIAAARGRRLVVGLTVAATLTAFVLTLARVLSIGAYEQDIGGWGAPLGIGWRIDGFAVLMLGLSVVVGAVVSIYSLAYFGEDPGDRRRALFFWPLWLFLWSALHGLFLSRDLFNWYVTLELSGLAAVALIALSGRADALTGSLRYLLLALAASLLYLLGVVVLYSATGTLDLAQVASRMTPGPVALAAVLLITTGLVVKAALFPAHFWLPSAHASAPSPVSAVLSALVVKGGFYILARTMTGLWPAASADGVLLVLGWLGGAAVLWGSLLAIRQQRLKLVIAYSTVAQLGYLFIAFPFWMDGVGEQAASRAWAGAAYQAVSHGLAKAALFLAAGVLIHARGRDDLDALRGLGAHLPVTATAMALAGISLMGIPPGAGFLPKWMLMTAALQEGRIIPIMVLMAGGLLAVGYLFRIFRRLLVADDVALDHAPPRTMEIAALVLGILSVIAGLSSLPILSLLSIGAPEGMNAYLEGVP